MKDLIILERVVNNIVVTEHLYSYEDLFRFIHDVLPKEVAMELDEYINQLELRLETVSTELELYAKDIENLENQLEELKSNSVKRGKWLYKGMDGDWQWHADGKGQCWHNFECSICHKKQTNENYTYCPNCGAKMDGDN